MSLNAFAFANVAASQTDAALITGSTNRYILVTGIACECAATATTIVFNTKPAGSGVAITMLFANPANGGFVLPYSDGGWFKTNSGDSLTCTTGAGSTTGIQITYTFVQVPGTNT